MATVKMRPAVAVSALALACLFRSEAASADALQPSDVALKPDCDFLVFRTEGGTTSVVKTYALRGDGQFTVSLSAYASATPELLLTGQLSDGEVSQTVEALFSSNLYEYDRADLLRRHRLEPNPGVAVEDVGSMQVEIHLPLLPGSDAAGRKHLDKVFGVDFSDMYRGHYPSIREYAALREILGRFEQFEVRRKRTGASR
ncbi:MAG: hypothetical protein ABI639_09185 [Thermoanaerobaculia bacterium]